MNDPLRRSLRTLLQIGLPGLIIALLQGFDLIHWTPAQTVLVLAVATPLTSWAQNQLEETTNFPALLKAPASSGQNPVPDPTP